MSQTSNTVSPCSHLNDDVLREIFTRIIYTEDFESKNISRRFVVAGKYRPFQLGVSQVCSSWRDIALLTPQLWDNICICDLTEDKLSTAREYLSRAGNLPVSISIEQCKSGRHWQDWHSQLTDFLSSYRIRTLEFIAEKMWGFHLVLPDLPQRSVAELQYLSIKSWHPDQRKAQIDLNGTRYPKLAVLEIHGGYKISSFNSLSSLRILYVPALSMTVIESWDLLSHCSSLERVWLRITQFNGSRRPVSMPQIHLQRLRRLVLGSDSEIPFSTFIEVLSLPVLERLTLRNQAVMPPATAFQSLAHRSNYFPHLTSFDLENSTSIVDAGILLASMPWVKEISLCPDTTTNKVVFDDLALNGLASGSLTPRLRSLKVGRILNMGLFLDMVESRMKNARMSSNRVPARFTEVVLFDYHGGYRDRCRDMRKRGIPIKSQKD
ncbi:hypothetical protein JOM56_002927 [Amanita muscaria]